jgi:mono/diheme cytochrome c family protein
LSDVECSTNLKLNCKLYTKVVETQVFSDHQVTASNYVIQKMISVVLLGALAVLLSGFAFYSFHHIDPYVESVLVLKGDAERGASIFQINCSSCHGTYADGKVGPSLRHVSDRKSPTALIEQVISGKTPPMPQFQPGPQDMADLLEYLEGL